MSIPPSLIEQFCADRVSALVAGPYATGEESSNEPSPSPNLRGYSLQGEPLSEIFEMKASGLNSYMRTAEFRGRKIVLKRVLAKREPSEHEQTVFQREAEVLAHLDSARGETSWEEVCLSRYLGVVLWNEKKVGFGFELAAGGNLTGYIESQAGRRDWCRVGSDQLVRLTRQITTACAFLTRAGVAHLDLKPDNIVLYEGPNGLQAAVTDFGLSRLPEKEPANDGYVVTRWYRSPEISVELGDCCAPPADMWSVAIVVMECVIGSPPFKGNSWYHQLYLYTHYLGKAPDPFIERVRNAAIRGTLTRAAQRSDSWRHERIATIMKVDKLVEGSTQAKVVDFCNQLLKWSPDERMTAEEALLHPLLTNDGPASSTSANDSSQAGGAAQV